MAKKSRSDRSRSDVSRRRFIKGVLGGAVVLPGLAALPPTVLAQTASSVVGTDSGGGSASTSGGSSEVGLVTTGDTFIRLEAPNTNEGGNPRLRVGVRPITRGLVSFDPAEIEAQRRRPDFSAATVHLVLTIASNHNDWGQTDDRTVDAHPLREDFVEGNGRQSGMPGSQQVRATGLGATWNSPDDPNVNDNRRPRSRARRWNGGGFGRATAPGVVHLNHMLGPVEWDVTADVRAGATAWLLRVTDESRADLDGPPPRDPGFDRGFGGTVEYFTRESATADVSFAPMLVFTFPAASSGGSSSSAPAASGTSASGTA